MISDAARILVVDDERDHADAAAEALRRVGYDVATAYTSQKAFDLIDRQVYNVIVTDMKLDGEDGAAVLRKARSMSTATQVIILTGYGTVESAVRAMRNGAFTYLEKGASLNLAQLRAVVKKAVEKTRQTGAPVVWSGGLDGVIGDSAAVRKVARLVKAVAPTSATVLIVGESGTGKELIAQSLHANSPRRDKPFVALNCAALSEGILESELFGHEKGSFSGALATRKGRFEYADGGTLFLDEVGDMPASTQVKLLRVLEYGEVFRVGSNEPIRVDVRLVAATNKELEREVTEGRFREDLYFRLKVVTLYLPPLREHKEDIPPLVDAFVREFSEVHKKRVAGISPEAREVLMRYRWHGNVRELRNCIESMVVIGTSEVLDVGDLPDYVLRGTRPALAAPKEEAVDAVALPAEGITLREANVSDVLFQTVKGTLPAGGITLREAERELIEKTLEQARGNREEAAKLLGIGERTLYRKINEYDLR